jgi:hypothetical protein
MEREEGMPFGPGLHGRSYSFTKKLIDSTLFPKAGENDRIRSRELRGSIRWQTGELAKAIFEASVSKTEMLSFLEVPRP